MSASEGMALHEHDRNDALATSSPDVESPPEKNHKSRGTLYLASNVSHFPGKGTANNPYIVDWDLGEPANPYNWTKRRKCIVTAQVLNCAMIFIMIFYQVYYLQLALSTFTVSFGSSSYSGGLSFIEHDLHISEDVTVLGISLYVLGFGIGPLVMAPLSEVRLQDTIFYLSAIIKRCVTRCWEE